MKLYFQTKNAQNVFATLTENFKKGKTVFGDKNTFFKKDKYQTQLAVAQEDHAPLKEQ